MRGDEGEGRWECGEGGKARSVNREAAGRIAAVRRICRRSNLPDGNVATHVSNVKPPSSLEREFVDVMTPLTRYLKWACGERARRREGAAEYL